MMNLNILSGITVHVNVTSFLYFEWDNCLFKMLHQLRNRSTYIIFVKVKIVYVNGTSVSEV
jgi:hypothetical protein